MQQTENLKLNIIESTDTFSPEPLNRNTRKIDEVLAPLDEMAKISDGVVWDLVRHVGQLGIITRAYLGIFPGQRAMLTQTFPKTNNGLYSLSGGATIEEGILRFKTLNATATVVGPGFGVDKPGWTRVRCTLSHKGGSVSFSLNGVPLEPVDSCTGMSYNGMSCMEVYYVGAGSGSSAQPTLVLTTKNEPMEVYSYTMYFY